MADIPGSPRAINFRVTAEEFAVLDAWAFILGTTPTDLAREETRALIARAEAQPGVRDMMRRRAQIRAEVRGDVRRLRTRDGDAG